MITPTKTPHEAAFDLASRRRVTRPATLRAFVIAYVDGYAFAETYPSEDAKDYRREARARHRAYPEGFLAGVKQARRNLRHGVVSQGFAAAEKVARVARSGAEFLSAYRDLHTASVDHRNRLAQGKVGQTDGYSDWQKRVLPSQRRLNSARQTLDNAILELPPAVRQSLTAPRAE